MKKYENFCIIVYLSAFGGEKIFFDELINASPSKLCRSTDANSVADA